MIKLPKASFLWLSLALLTLGACATPPKVVDHSGRNWFTDSEYFTKASRLKSNPSWKYTAKVGVTTKERRDQASIDWRFADQSNAIRLFGPLGFGAVRIEYDQFGAVISDNKGVRHQGRNVESLINRIVGWPIPVEALSDWLFLKPKDSSPFRYQLDDQNQLFRLEQLGWQITYTDYRDYNGQQMPRKITALRLLPEGHQRAAKVKLVTKNWQW